MLSLNSYVVICCLEGDGIQSLGPAKEYRVSKYPKIVLILTKYVYRGIWGLFINRNLFFILFEPVVILNTQK